MSEPSGEPPSQDAATVPVAVTAPRRRLRDRWVLLTVLITLAVLVGGSALAVAGLATRLQSNIDSIDDPFEALPSRPPVVTPTPTPGVEAPARAAMNVLVLGSDSRISAGDPSDWVAGAQRTDAIMLVHLPANAEDAWVMSIPRDSWVDIPGHGTAKINAAYSYGGPTLLIQTVEQLTQVRIDHFAVADFESFVEVTDAIGGVEIELSESLYGRADMGTAGELLATAGTQTLSGTEALTWVRERYSLRRGDFDRVQRQQAWMRGILTKVRDEGVLSNPVRSVRFLDTVTQSLAIDDGVSLGVMQDMVGRVKDLGSGDLHFLTVPVQGTGRSPDGAQSIVVLNRPAFDALMVAVANDTVGEYLAQNDAAVDTLGTVAP